MSVFLTHPVENIVPTTTFPIVTKQEIHLKYLQKQLSFFLGLPRASTIEVGRELGAKENEINWLCLFSSGMGSMSTSKTH